MTIEALVEMIGSLEQTINDQGNRTGYFEFGSN